MLLLNNHPIEYFQFSGGEYQVKLPASISQERVVLTWKPSKPEDIILLALTVNALKKAGIWDIDIDVLYLPYARQDRVCAPGEANSLEVICSFLDNLDVTPIRIWDVHNQKATHKLFISSDVYHITAKQIFERYRILDGFDLSNLILCAPDFGAYLSVAQVVSLFDIPVPIHLQKVRCPETGRIVEIVFPPGSRRVDGYNIFIVDDICDGGATFIEAAKLLKKNGAVNLYLYVTHGIFSKGIEPLLEHFNHIYCHHVLHDDKFKSSENLTILQEFPA